MNFSATSISIGSIINSNILEDSNPDHKAVVLAKKECSYYDDLYTTLQNPRNHIYQKHRKKVERHTKNDHSNAAHIYNKTNIGNCNRERVKILVKLACISCSNVMNIKSKLVSHIYSIRILTIHLLDDYRQAITR